MTLSVEGTDGITPRFNLTENGLVFAEGTTRAEWVKVGFVLANASKATTKWVADWTRYGMAQFGKAVVELESGQLMFAPLVLENARQLALLPEDVCESGVSPQHAKVLLEECSGPADMSRWAKLAIHEGLTPGELRESIEQGKVTRREESESRGIPTINGVRGLYDRWAASTLRERPLEGWPPEDLRALLDELKPIYLLCERAASIWKATR